jgi:hydrogenase maturation protease
MDLVVGIGNALRGDDGVGIRVVESLSPDARAEMLAVHQLTPALVEQLARAGRVLFVDADAASNGVQLTALCPVWREARLGHAVSAEELLQWILIEHDVCPPAWMLSVPARRFGFGEELSSEALRALPIARRVALDWLGGRSQEGPNEEDE